MSETTGTVVTTKKQWWIKINRKPVRMGALDGAEFPYIIKVEYTVNGQVYTRRKWISAGSPVPKVGSMVTVSYDENKPSRSKVI